MDPHKHLIIFKSQDKTTEIQSAEFDQKTGKWIIRFHGNPQEYHCNPGTAEVYQDPENLNPDEYRFLRNGRPLYKIKEVLKFDKEYRFWFENGSSLLLHEADLEVIHDCLTGITEKKAMEYFHAISEVVSLKTEEGEALLSKQLENLGFIGRNVVLSSYLNPQKYPIRTYEPRPLIFPFGCNESQKKAVEQAFTNQLTVIEGPPGTGKTQTILNIIANVLIQGKTVAVVSNNNSATLNVYEKLKKKDLDYLCAFLGNRENKNAFIEKQKARVFQAPVMTKEAWEKSLGEADEAQKALSRYLALQNEQAQLETECQELELERKHYYHYVKETFGEKEFGKIPLNLYSTQVLGLKVSLEEYAEKYGREALTWIRKLWLYIGFHIRNRMFLSSTIGEILTEFEWQYYDLRMHEIEERQKFIQKKLGTFSFDEKMAQMEQLSMLVLKEKMAQRFEGYPERKFSQEDLWKHPDDILKRYPIILSTTHSIRTSLSDTVYDYLIVDEASQVDLITGVFAMSCARNMIVVGDEKQLPNVITSRDMEEIALIDGKFAVPTGLCYGEHSLLTSVRQVFPDVAHVILREHYRCHPRIIQFCNKKFYQDQLIIMTEDRQELDVLKVYKTVVGNHARGRVNQRQIDEIKEEILPELLSCTIEEKDIGIISPYRDQADAAAMEVSGQLAVDTVHKFQGREKEAIIITTVDNVITEFADNPNLLNVAVSRAVSKLRLVISGNEQNENTNIGALVNYIAYEKGEVIQGTVFSVFDLLYSQYREVREAYLKNKRRISQVESENLCYYFLQELFLRENLQDFAAAVHVPLREIIKDKTNLDETERNFVQNTWSHVDFLIYRKVDKKPKLAIEVDGAAFHKKDSVQKEVRDKIKDRVFDKCGLPLLRLSTTGSGEAERIMAMLKG